MRMSEQENSATTVQNEGAETPVEVSGKREYSDKVLDAYEVARFWSRVEVKKRKHCWPWRWGTNPTGYGDLRFNDGEHELSHRMAYRIVNGPIEPGLIIRHTCDNPICCNPAHLIKGTHADNVADRVGRDRSAKGEVNGRHKLTELEVRLIRASPLSDKYFANRFDVHEDTVRDARRGKTWKHVSL
jgi:hypothetical protein